MAGAYGQPLGSMIDIENFTLGSRTETLGYNYNYFNLFEVFIIRYITFIMDYKKAYMKRGENKVSAYGQQWEETIHKDKMLDKAINR